MDRTGLAVADLDGLEGTGIATFFDLELGIGGVFVELAAACAARGVLAAIMPDEAGAARLLADILSWYRSRRLPLIVPAQAWCGRAEVVVNHGARRHVVASIHLLDGGDEASDVSVHRRASLVLLVGSEVDGHEDDAERQGELFGLLLQERQHVGFDAVDEPLFAFKGDVEHAPFEALVAEPWEAHYDGEAD
jgi:hypothetical protein